MDTLRTSPSEERPVAAFLDAVYATLEDGRWGDVLKLLCEGFASRCAALASHDFSVGRGVMLQQSPVDGPLGGIYAQRAAVDPWFLSKRHYLPCRAVSGLDIIGHQEFLKTDFYQDVLRPHALFHRLCGVLARDEDEVFYVVMYRGKDHPAYADKDKARLETLLPHLARAFEMRARMRASAQLALLLSCVVQTRFTRLFVVDEEGRIEYGDLRPEPPAPAAARNARPAIQDYLGVVDPWARGALASAIAQAAKAKVPEGEHEAQLAPAEPRSLRVYGTVDQIWLKLEFRALTVPPALGAASARRLVVITATDPSRDESHALRAFATRFALSPAETRVSALILQGCTPAAAATKLNLSSNTIRSHMKQIFLKTNTHRQAELITLLSRPA